MSIARTFLDLTEEMDVEQLAMLANFGWSKPTTWNDLLKSKRVLIVSEAGAGKTHECKAQSRLLWDAGEAAFYVDLAGLKDNDFPALLSTPEVARFEAWLAAQSDVATFFLDSIDELELTLGKFEAALKRFGRAVHGHLGRARIIITSRPIPIDEQVFRDELPVPPSADEELSAKTFADVAMRRTKDESKNPDAAAEWRSVALMPLSDAQIIEMARLQGVPDPVALLADIKSRNAQEFARRPQDLIELCIDWKDNRRVRNHADQVAHNIAIKLRPRPPSERRERAQLDEDRALEGASRLALAALLGRKLTFRHSAKADIASAEEAALDPAAILSDWTSDERATLLERSLFGFATYGRVKFHHRSVTEFLAAERLHNRMGAGMRVRAVKRLLFAKTAQNEWVIKSSMKPVAAWLARRRSSIFARVLEIEPSVLLDFGDPQSLTTQQRAEALRAYVERYGRGGWRGLDAPRLQVERFAFPELSPEVKRLWAAGIENREVRELLLNLIAAAKMGDCADLAYAHARNTAAEQNERIDAVEALISLDDARLPKITKSIISNRKSWPERLARMLIIRLFPRYITPEQLCRILRTLTPKRKGGGDLTGHLPYLIAEGELSLKDISELRGGLYELVAAGLEWNAQLHDAATHRDDLVPALTAACLREWNESSEITPDLIRASVVAARLPKRHYDSDERSGELRRILATASADQREAAFWIDDAIMQGLHPQVEAGNRLAAIAHDAIFLDYDADWGWICAALADRARSLTERQLLLAAAYWVVRGEGWREQLGTVRPLVEDEPELAEALKIKLAPTQANERHEQWQREHEQRKKAEARKERKAHKSWVKFWEEISNKPDEVFGEDRTANTAWNLWRAMKAEGAQGRASGWNRRFIEGHFGKEAADRLRVTLMRAWRADHPTLRSERKATEKNQYLVRWQLGVAAIAAEAEDPNWARILTDGDAKLAARFAPIGLNGFPSWLEPLALAQPAAVDAVLGSELSLELSEPAIAESHSMILQNISHAAPALAATFVGRLRTWLDETEGEIGHNEDPTVGSDRLSRVLEILAKHGGEDAADHIRAMAKRKLDTGVSREFAGVWLPMLMRLAPPAGVAHLERLLLNAPVEPEGLGAEWFASLFGDRHRTPHINLKHPEFTPRLLLQMVRLAYHHVRFDQDIHHEGSYSPGLRDNAQDARNALLSALLDRTGTDAWAAKLELANDPNCSHIRDRLRALARDRLADEADDLTLDPAQIAALDRHGEAAPSSREAMFALLGDKLDDLDDVLLQETSPWELWAGIADEKLLRREVAREFVHMSKETYKVDQEAVTADEKETDIRLRSTASSQQATIELKIGDKKRSATDLRHALRKQLVKKYMAAEDCRSGCLLISLAKDRTWKHPDTGKTIEFDALIEMLNDEAGKITLEMGGEIRLMAKGLDLRPRLAVEERD